MWKGCAGTERGAKRGFRGPARARGHDRTGAGDRGQVGPVARAGKVRLAAVRRARAGRSASRAPTSSTYPVVVHAQTPVTVALKLHGAVAPEDIEAIAIETYWVAERYVDRKNALWHPATRETADHSIPVLRRRGAAGRRRHGEDASRRARIRDPRIAALLERTTIRENPDFSKAYPHEWPCRIEIEDPRRRAQDAPRRDTSRATRRTRSPTRRSRRNSGRWRQRR